ncbi:hypothetical protein F511_15705 [Dorcoceras hygrometricum]|uniref:Uncharacterized protein n=1 Tax=Dorcoceras hygrometricum TaxID=472368 RepID=A0A2Z7BEI9_9LAMI|nr:hypothetical protein F511_15705 [Dorcoceras hygrometricum]
MAEWTIWSRMTWRWSRTSVKIECSTRRRRFRRRSLCRMRWNQIFLSYTSTQSSNSPPGFALTKFSVATEKYPKMKIQYMVLEDMLAIAGEHLLFKISLRLKHDC